MSCLFSLSLSYPAEMESNTKDWRTLNADFEHSMRRFEKAFFSWQLRESAHRLELMRQRMEAEKIRSDDRLEKISRNLLHRRESDLIPAAAVKPPAAAVLPRANPPEERAALKTTLHQEESKPLGKVVSTHACKVDSCTVLCLVPSSASTPGVAVPSLPEEPLEEPCRPAVASPCDDIASPRNMCADALTPMVETATAAAASKTSAVRDGARIVHSNKVFLEMHHVSMVASPVFPKAAPRSVLLPFDPGKAMRDNAPHQSARPALGRKWTPRPPAEPPPLPSQFSQGPFSLFV